MLSTVGRRGKREGWWAREGGREGGREERWKEGGGRKDGRESEGRKRKAGYRVDMASWQCVLVPGFRWRSTLIDQVAYIISKSTPAERPAGVTLCAQNIRNLLFSQTSHGPATDSDKARSFNLLALSLLSLSLSLLSHCHTSLILHSIVSADCHAG